MKPTVIGYWVVTALLVLVFASGGVMDLRQSPEVLEGMKSLGYPAYFATLLGLWKLAGALALVVPGFARVKEWAYAGMFFDLTGAAVSHAAVGDPLPKVLVPLVLTGLLVASWALRPSSRRAVLPASSPQLA
ncbi:MAG: DoxX family protein [Archangium sp.]|nr:DoxX family protein [Archangium sp.]